MFLDPCLTVQQQRPLFLPFPAETAHWLSFAHFGSSRAGGVAIVVTVTPLTALASRRKKLLLREAIAAVQAAGAMAGAMADEIQSSLSQPGQDEVLAATEEMVSLRVLAGDVQHVIETILRRERAEGYLPL